MRTQLVLATRRSALALAQSRAFAEKLKSHFPGLAVTELQVVTEGDRIQDKPLTDIGGKGLFVKELEAALLSEHADFAVHSIKDVPFELEPNLVISCIPRREDPRDAFISRDNIPLAGLRQGARLGTSSLRRLLSLKALRPDLDIVPLRGNVDTRLRKLDNGEYDAIVLATAGLNRLGLAGRITHALSPEESLPAIGQGALGIECRAADDSLRSMLRELEDPVATICVEAERGVMAAAEGNCRTPIAAYAEKRGEELFLRAFVANPDGTNPRRGERHTPMPETPRSAHQLGFDLGRELKALAAS